MGEQVFDQNRPLNRMGSIQWAARIIQHPQVGEFRQPAHDRVAQRHLALVNQAHQGRDGDRLGHRRDAEQRVSLHR